MNATVTVEATPAHTEAVPEQPSAPSAMPDVQQNSVKQRPFAKLRKHARRRTPLYSSAPITVMTPSAVNRDIKRVVEALLFAAQQPMTAKQLQDTFPELEQPDLPDIQAAIAAIMADYQARPVELIPVASGYRFQVRREFSPWVARLFAEKPPKYSRALLETLAIIAYRQPVTRGDIEDIRGVSVSSSMMQTLQEREWIRIIAHKEVPGRPALYGTTKQFLDYFNLSNLNELPTLQVLQSLDVSINDILTHTDTGKP